MLLQSHRKHVPQYAWTDHFLDASGYGIMSRKDRSQWYDGVRFGRNVRPFYVECTLIRSLDLSKSSSPKMMRRSRILRDMSFGASFTNDEEVTD